MEYEIHMICFCKVGPIHILTIISMSFCVIPIGLRDKEYLNYGENTTLNQEGKEKHKTLFGWIITGICR